MEMPESFRFETNIPLAELTSFRVGGPARFVLRPQSYEEIRQVMEYAASVEMPVTQLG